MVWRGTNGPVLMGVRRSFFVQVACGGHTVVLSFRVETIGSPVDERTVKGDPTDTALLRFSEGQSVPSLGINAASIVQSWTKTFEIPFNSRNKWVLTVVTEGNDGAKKGSDEAWMLVKGVPDVLFQSCSSMLRSDGMLIPFAVGEQQRLSELQDEWSSEGQHVLALCRKSHNGIKLGLPPNDMEELMYAEMQDLTLVGIRDPSREDVPAAIETIRHGGVRVFMVTGDFKLTAVAITCQRRINTIDDIRMAASEKVPAVSHYSVKPDPDAPNHALVLTGEDVDALTAPDWDVIIGVYTEIVFACTTPDQKMRIVEEIKYRGDNTVAVTGDGVNDAPALKAADIGVAMGSGSDVAKEAAALILLKNNFASIPVAIEMGRLMFDNLKKAGNYTEFMAVLSSVLLGMQMPMSTYQQVCFMVVEGEALNMY
ncbi:HAD-like domain-containing protein [Melanogaster broomeanus]|nr:HAD-like domain-containing protein [Melanogaster broomeanus]